MTELREIIARAYAHKSVGDPNAIDHTGRPRWEWFLDTADEFLSVHGYAFADRAPFITEHMAADAAMVLNKALAHGNLFGVSREMLRTALAVQPTREQLGEMIYRAMYEHEGGMWSNANPPDFWYAMADRLIALLQETRK